MEEDSADIYYNKFLNLIRLGRIDEAKIFARRAVELNNTLNTLWSFRRSGLGNANECFKNAEELAFK